MWVLPFLERLGRRRKRSGASGVWTAVALAAFLLRQYDKRIRNDVDVLREELKPGETLLITHNPPTRG